LASFTLAYFSNSAARPTALTRQLGGDTRVEQPPRPESVVTIENPQVVVRVVEDLLDLGVGEQPPDR